MRNKRLRLPRRLRFTREGKYFFWLTVGIGLGAVNTGNNLLYLLLGMLLSLIIVSGILSNVSLKSLHIQRHLPQRMFAETPCLITLTISNKKRYFPSFSIEIEDRIEGHQKSKKCYFLKIGPQQEQKTAYRLELPRRGEYTFQEVTISTKFPFSLFVKSRVIQLEQTCLVYPKLMPILRPPMGRHLFQQGQQPHAERGQGNNFFMLREMQPGDELRWIHWPSSARTGKWQVKEFEREHRPQAHLLLWNVAPDTLNTEEATRYIDKSIDLAASFAYSYISHGHPVHFATAEQTFPVLHTEQELDQLLRQLAVLSPHQPTSPNRKSPHMVVVLPEHSPAPSLPPSVRQIRIPSPWPATEG